MTASDVYDYDPTNGGSRRFNVEFAHFDFGADLSQPEIDFIQAEVQSRLRPLGNCLASSYSILLTVNAKAPDYDPGPERIPPLSSYAQLTPKQETNIPERDFYTRRYNSKWPYVVHHKYIQVHYQGETSPYYYYELSTHLLHGPLECA